ncbi:MAG TPA: thioesterase domain-containing protein, partial [Verrucomicrobiae bacterium]|nr:thioesterase domain-containing protein [Verrucomicrobiae bacterium]
SDRHGDARLYKTGDLARYLPNGEIEFLGRMDHQVKIRGFRIELGEIEAVLRQHAGVSETVVVAREDAPGDKRVVAYFVPKASAPANPVELRAFLKEKLPVYMLPSAFVKLGRIPLTPNGKVDRRVLPTPDPSDFAAGQEPVSPRDEVESQLVTTWEDVLGVRPIGIRDNFFDLGGHSILAVRLMNRIAETLDKNLPISTLLQAPTVEKLAAMIRQQGSLPAWSCLVPIQTSGSQPPFFCVHGINGAVVRFRDLAKYLGPDQPFYGLQAHGLGDQNPCHTRTEEMAAHYIQDVRKVQPRGPYFLGGYSFGGAIAFEMALQLAAEGDEGTTVVLFDTNLTSPLVPSTHSISARAAFLQSFRVPASELGAHLLRILRAPLRMLQWKLHVAKLPPIVRRVRKACLQAERSYLPRVYRGRVILFRSNHRALGQVGDPRAGWQHYVSRGLEIYEITGNHENILLEPQVREVADSLKLCLQSAPEAQVLRA